MAGRAVTVTLGGMAERTEAHIASGRYASMSEVVRAGIRALDREEAAMTAYLKKLVEEALADPRPLVSIDEAFAEVRAAAKRRRER